MKEDVLDVLMYLFQNYISDMEDQDPQPDRESVQTELLEAGFSVREVTQALEWLDGLAERREAPVVTLNAGGAFRVYTEQEITRLDVECRGFLLFLEQAGVLTSETRELVVDRTMALDADDIDLTQLKWIILMVLFNHPGQEEAYAWMEDLLFEDMTGYIH